MSPAHSRWFFAGFSAVLTLVVVNAHRQPPRAAVVVAASPSAAKRALVVASPAPPAARTVQPVAEARPAPNAPVPKVEPEPIKLAAISEPVRIPTRLPTASMVGQLPLPTVVDGDADTVRRLQKDLVDAGYGPLVVNGNAGHLTRAAIMAFEFDHAMALTGEASERILKRLAARGAATPPAEPDQRRIATQDAEQVVLIVQKSLQSLGKALTIDGRIGPETDAAIRAFESDNGMKPTGRVSADLFSALGRAIVRAKADGG